MATYSSYAPTSPIGRAMFNFDVYGISNFKLTGTVRVSVSDSFNSSDYLNFHFDSDLYTTGSNEVAWTAQMVANIQDVLGIFSQFANIPFEWKGDYEASPPGSDTTPNSMDVGLANLSDININWISRSDVDFAGVSGINSDSSFGYAGGAGDIFLNQQAFSSNTLDLNTRARQTLEHELGHSLGLAHPHSAYNNGVPTITADYAATKDLGFDQLGFRTATAADMYKEFFTIMSYDDQQSVLQGSFLFHSHTPMILDVIALQQAYGEGSGTTGAANDTITAGTAGYRTYFDKGGADTIDMSMYDDGVYLHMGASIVGAAHMVGVGMSRADELTMESGGNPTHLRWFYGEYENARGGSNADRIVGNSLDNAISAQAGNDTVSGGAGNDRLDGGPGNDYLDGGVGTDLLDYTSATAAVNVNLASGTASGGAGTDTVLGFEDLQGSGFDDALTGNALANYLAGGAGNDYAAGGAGNDRLEGGAGADYLDGGPDSDMLDYSNASAGVTVNLATGTASGGAGPDTLLGIEDLRGGSFADVLIGSASGNYVEAGAGNDRVDGGPGSDYLDGGAGTDLLDYATSAAAVTVNLGAGTVSGGAGTDTVLEFEDLRGGAFDDALTGNALNNYLSGAAGNDYVAGAAGNDRLEGGPGDDYLDGGADSDMLDYTGAGAAVNVSLGAGTTSGAAGNDIVVGIEDLRGSGSDDALTGNALNNYMAGAAGNDYVAGGFGDDYLDAGTGDDYLVGGAGADILVGNAGQDTFVLRAGDGGGALNLADVLTDYQDSTDSIGLSGGLTYANLVITQGTGSHVNDTVIQRSSGEFLAVVQNVNSTTLDIFDFKTVAG